MLAEGKTNHALCGELKVNACTTVVSPIPANTFAEANEHKIKIDSNSFFII
jgi:hypothetical protein